jgi:CelD/BcsL family acetyltransferase involved in cellulose biosynthesis
VICTEEISTGRELRGLRPIWDDILARSRVNDVFSTWDWAVRWWEHFGSGRRLKVLLARENDEVIGLAPLVVSEYGLAKVGSVTRVEFLGSPQSNYNNFILARNEEACLRAFLGYLNRQSDWDWLQLTDLREDTLSAKLVCSSPEFRRWRLEPRVGAICFFVELPNSIEDFNRKLDGHLRRDLRRQMRGLEKEHVVEIKTHADFGSIENAMKVLFELHQRRWNLKGKPGAFAASAVRDFHIAIARDFEKRGWLSMYFLTADDSPVASLYCYEYGRKIYACQTGFDPCFAPRWSVGKQLFARSIEISISKGLLEYDFMRGVYLHKLFWPTKVRKNLKVDLIRSVIVAKAYRLLTGNHTLRNLAMKASEQLPLLHGL